MFEEISVLSVFEISAHLILAMISLLLCGFLFAKSFYMKTKKEFIYLFIFSFLVFFKDSFAVMFLLLIGKPFFSSLSEFFMELFVFSFLIVFGIKYNKIIDKKLFFKVVILFSILIFPVFNFITNLINLIVSFFAISFFLVFVLKFMINRRENEG